MSNWVICSVTWTIIKLTNFDSQYTVRVITIVTTGATNNATRSFNKPIHLNGSIIPNKRMLGMHHSPRRTLKRCYKKVLMILQKTKEPRIKGPEWLVTACASSKVVQVVHCTVYTMYTALYSRFPTRSIIPIGTLAILSCLSENWYTYCLI